MSESGPGSPTDSCTDGDKDSSVRVCRECGKEYAGREGLRWHYRASSNDCTGPQCPTCDAPMVSGRGVELHHKKEHGESISGVVVECEVCGKEHRKRPSRVRYNTYNYCSPECQAEHYSTEDSPLPNPSGEDAPQYNSVEYDCDNCGKTTLRQMSRVKRNDYLYCSQECHWEGLSDRYSDGGHPMFKTGAYGYAGPKWLDIAESARERYNHTCQGCGVAQSDLGYTLNVHHIVPLRKFDSYEEANEEENLVPLCNPCHGRWEGLGLKPELMSD